MEVKKTDSGIIFSVKLRPRASRDRLVGVENDFLRMEVSAAPVGGKANRSLVRLIGQILKVPRHAVTIRRGEKQPLKLIAVSGLSPEDFWRKIDEQSNG